MRSRDELEREIVRAAVRMFANYNDLYKHLVRGNQSSNEAKLLKAVELYEAHKDIVNGE